MKMKRVLISITTLFGGGAERAASVWANQLSEIGYDVSILLYGRTKDEYPIRKSINVYTVANSYEEYKRLKYYQRIIQMRRIVKRIDPDVIISFLPRMQIWMMFSTLFLKVKRIETVRVSPWSTFENPRGIESILWSICFKRANRIIVQTDEQALFFSPKLQKRCITIPNAISSEYNDSYITDYFKSVAKFVAVGRIVAQKNYSMMISAFARAKVLYPEITLDIWGLGEEDYISELMKLIKKLGVEDCIHFRGRSNNMPKVYLKYNAFLMSSLFEGMPNALLEAMATGLICISTDCKTGPKDLIQDGVNGFLVPNKDEDLFFQAICIACSMTSKEIEAMGINARLSVRNKCNNTTSLERLVSTIESC